MKNLLLCLAVSIIYLTLAAHYSYAENNENKVLTVEEAVKIAKQNNPSIVLNQADIAISRAELRKAKSNYYPQIKSRLILPLIGTESGISLDQLIWDFGKTSSLVKAKELDEDISEYDYQDNLDDVVSNTKISYYRVLIAKNKVESAKKLVDKNELILAKTRELVKTGRSSNLDLTRANSRLAESKLQLTNLENLVETYKLDLFSAMGIEPDDSYELVGDTDIEKLKYDLNESIDMAYTNSLMLKKLEAERVGIQAKLGARKSEFFPEIFGRTAYRLKGKGTDTEGTDTPSFIAGVGIKFPIFLGFSRIANLNEAKAQYVRSESKIKQAKQQVSSNVKKTYMDLRYAINRIDVTRSNLNQASENLELIKEKEKAGRASSLDLVDAESFHAQSLSNYREAIYFYKITKTKYDQLIGKLE